MRRFTSGLLAAAVVTASTGTGLAQSVTPSDMPWYMQDSMPQAAHEAAWNEYKAVYGPDTAVPPKYKQLIALAVAAQIPCDYCIYGHSAAAGREGATQDEIKDALAVAALVRKWSTSLNGAQIDFEKFRTTVDGGAPSN